ncbi:MAG: flagellar basal body P-ring formation protein FlgA [Sneathiella sp.]|nr:flagellar basal body P-ring formation protein FlgA [Sneathiella sp.]
MKHIGIFILTTLSLIVASVAAAATPVTLKNNPVVEGDSITFGDIFEGAGDKDDYVIASAPEPGKSITFKASSVAFVARKHGLDWQPTRAISLITVNRSGQIIPHQEVSLQIRAALEMEIGTDMFDMDLPNRFKNIHIRMDEEPTVAVESLAYNESKNSFTATLLAPASSDNPKRYRVSGKYFPQVMVPVTTRLIRKGEEITERDIDIKPVRANRVGRNIILDIGELVGKAPRRSIRTGATFNLNNLGDPVTVAKGKSVAVIFKRGGISLTMMGRALENGSTGDIIRVENTKSRKVVQAEVLNEREVLIITAQQQLANLR